MQKKIQIWFKESQTFLSKYYLLISIFISFILPDSDSEEFRYKYCKYVYIFVYFLSLYKGYIDYPMNSDTVLPTLPNNSGDSCNFG